MINNKKKPINFVILLILLSILLALSIYSIPQEHSLVGKVYYSEGSNVPNNIPVFINLTETNNTYRTLTYGPPPSPNNYGYEVIGEDNELVIVRAWNETHYGENSTNLVNAPGTTSCNAIINMSRYSEANVTIVAPSNDTVYDKGDNFNVTANITMLGNDSRACTAAINFSNISIINISSTESATHSLGDIAFGSWRNTTWEVSAYAIGFSDITVTVTCDSDSVNLEGLNAYSAGNITAEAPPPTVYLESPANNTKIYYANVTFYYNVSSDNTISNCSLIINGKINHTNKTITEDVSQNFTVNDMNVGEYNWSVNCTDNVGQVSSSPVYNLTLTTAPDMVITSAGILFSNSNPVERENITITANVSNEGNANAEDVIVQFFNGNYTLGNQIGNSTINITMDGWNTTNVTFEVQMGTNNIYVVVDPPLDTNGLIDESDESNNYAYSEISLTAWHIFAGNMSGNLVLSPASDGVVTKWDVSNTSGGKIYVADYDSTVNFDSLAAFGRNLSNATRMDDFQELDNALDLGNFSESINRSYTFQENVKNEFNFTIFSKMIYCVPIINSTNSSAFITGILWDSSDDNQNLGTEGEYDTTDSEDVVFVTEVNDQDIGMYGVYDFEIRVPASLRSYSSGADTTSVALYGEII